MSLRILLADDHAVLRDGLKSLLQSEGCTVVGEASNGNEAVILAEKLRPDVAVMDVTMPLLNGVDATQQIRQVSPDTKIIVLSMHSEDQYVLAALRAGAVGYVLKTRAASDLLQAVRDVSRGDMYLSSGVSRAVVQGMLTPNENRKEVLTPRERQVLQLIAEGKTTKEVAVQLGVSTKTGESHRARLMEKLGIHETAGLVRYAIRHGLIQP